MIGTTVSVYGKGIKPKQNDTLGLAPTIKSMLITPTAILLRFGVLHIYIYIYIYINIRVLPAASEWSLTNNFLIVRRPMLLIISAPIVIPIIVGMEKGRAGAGVLSRELHIVYHHAW